MVHYHQRGVTTDSAMQLPCETPVALVYNGIAHSVMMCSAADLEDFAIGFSLSGDHRQPARYPRHRAAERLPRHRAAHHPGQSLRSSPEEKRRTLAGRTGCGICGSESLEQVVRAQPRLPDSQRFAVGHIDKVLAALRPLQLLGQSTGRPMPPCTWMAGNILAIREDVGRHIALDKLVGHLQRSQRRDGAILVTSRASFEMVQSAPAPGWRSCSPSPLPPSSRSSGPSRPGSPWWASVARGGRDLQRSPAHPAGERGIIPVSAEG